MAAPRSAARPWRRLFAAPLARRLFLVPVLLFTLAPAFFPLRTLAAPQLWLPTPPGQEWKVVQGYGCGTHEGYDRYSLDLVAAEGETRGAPVYAAADGTVWAWTPGSGSLVIDHGGGFKTLYTHMQEHFFGEGDFVARGAVVGTVGNVGAEWTIPHLHFTFFHSDGGYSLGSSVPLSFVEGYDLADLGGCNQHGGEELVSLNGKPDDAAPQIEFVPGPLEANRWYNSDMRLDFVLSDDVVIQGFSQTWDEEPGDEEPMFTGAHEGYVQLDWGGEGLHTIYVRAWDASGKQTVASFGPMGYDKTPPAAVSAIVNASDAANKIAATGPITLTWQAPPDGNGSGVAGYRLYLGPDANGTDDWFERDTSVVVNPEPGSYYFRLQAIDGAGNSSPWATAAQFTRQAPLPPSE